MKERSLKNRWLPCSLLQQHNDNMEDGFFFSLASVVVVYNKRKCFQRQRCNYFTHNKRVREKHRNQQHFGWFYRKKSALLLSQSSLNPEVTAWCLWTSCFSCLLFLLECVRVCVCVWVGGWVGVCVWAWEAATEVNIQPQHCHLMADMGNYSCLIFLAFLTIISTRLT